MFDTMTLTKITAAFCAALLVFVLGGWIGDKVYSPGHHGKDHQASYIIDTGEDDTEVAEADAGPSITELLASADVGKGENVFKKCSACHALNDGENGVGPHLYGLIDRATASVDGYGYSGALVAVTPDWNVEALDAFLAAPKKYAPGTAMGFAGLKKPTDRANVIAYLQTIGN